MKDAMITIVIPNPTRGTCPISEVWFTILTGPVFRNFVNPNVAEKKDIENDSQINHLLSPSHPKKAFSMYSLTPNFAIFNIQHGNESNE